MDSLSNKAGFFGKVTASTTHEQQNVFAIIKENSGLMEDILLIHKGGDLSDIEEKLKKCITSVKNQAIRGVGVTSGLNYFAHTTDNIENSVNVLELTKKFIVVTERMFKQKNVTITISEPEQSSQALIDPVFFQMVVFLCLECLAEHSENTGHTFIEIRFLDNMPDITFLCNESSLSQNDYRDKMTSSTQWEEILNLCRQANFTAKIVADVLGITICLK